MIRVRSYAGFTPDNCLFRLKFSLASQLARFTRFGQVRQITYFNDVGENLSLAVEVVHPAYSLYRDNKELTFYWSLVVRLTTHL
jgi:hypothetical protein